MYEDKRRLMKKGKGLQLPKEAILSNRSILETAKWLHTVILVSSKRVILLKQGWDDLGKEKRIWRSSKAVSFRE